MGAVFWKTVRIVTLLLLSVSPVALRAESSVPSLEIQRQESQNELKRLQAVLAEEKENIRRARKDEAGLLSTIDALEEDLEQLERGRRKIERDIAGLEDIMRSRELEIAELEEKIADIQRRISVRLRGIYKAGPAASLKLVLGADTPAQLQRRLLYMGRVLDHDRDMLAEHERAEQRLIEGRAFLEARQIERELASRRLEDTRTEILKERDERLAILASIRNERISYERAVRELSASRDRLSRLLEVIGLRIRSQMLADGQGLVDNAGNPLDFAAYKGALAYPVKGKIVSQYGRYVHPEFGTVTVSNGVTIGAQQGAQVQSVYPGVVVFADRMQGYGNLIIIDHGDTFYTVYAHAARLLKKPGDRVQAREPIALVGESGSLVGTACYFEIRRGGEPLDPADWLLPD